MRIKLLLIIVLFTFCFTTASANKIRRTNNFKSYNDPSQEIGYSLNLSYLRYEKSFSPQLHLHYAKYLTDYFSLGFGYGGIYDIHLHNTINAEFSFRFSEKLIFSLKPGLVFKNVRGNTNLNYSVGFEANYEIKLSDDIHIGPSFEINYMQDDLNLLAGFHMGFSF